MKALMIGACLAVLGAPALAQTYGQDQTDPYYDQGPPRPAPQPPAQGGYQGGYDQQNGPGQYDRGYGDEDESGAGQGSGAYQPPPAPPPGQPGFQNYQGAPQDQDGGGYGGYQPGYGQSQPQYGYQGGYSQHQPPQYGYQGGYAYQGYGGVAHYTGRTSGAWRNGEGQYCVWREMTWSDRYGRTAYRWTPRCR